MTQVIERVDVPEAGAKPAVMVEARSVRKTYRLGGVEVAALRGADLAIRRGEMVAIMGPSGCGKTTLLNCLSGLDEVDSGEILIEGVSIRHLSDRERTRYRARRMGFVFQFYNLLGVLTAVENVEMPLLLSGVPGKQARKKALALLARVGLAERAGHTPEELSGGERQRVTIARALVNDPARLPASRGAAELPLRVVLRGRGWHRLRDGASAGGGAQRDVGLIEATQLGSNRVQRVLAESGDHLSRRLRRRHPDIDVACLAGLARLPSAGPSLRVAMRLLPGGGLCHLQLEGLGLGHRRARRLVLPRIRSLSAAASSFLPLEQLRQSR